MVGIAVKPQLVGVMMNIGTWAVAAWFSILGQANPEAKLEDVARRATEAHKAALEEMMRAKGQGRYEYTLKRSSVDGETILDTRGDYSFAYSGAKNWGKFVKSVDGAYDATVYVSDPKSVMISHFSDDFKPFGATGIILGRSRPNVLPPELLVTPQRAITGWTFFQPGKGSHGENQARTLQKVEDHYVIQFEKDAVTKFYIDPNKGFHLVRYEYLELDGYTTDIVTKDWSTTAEGLWYVREYHKESFPIRAREHYESWRLTIDSIEPNVHISPRMFTLHGLELPVGAKIKDTRCKPNKIIRVRPPEMTRAFEADTRLAAQAIPHLVEKRHRLLAGSLSVPPQN